MAPRGKPDADAAVDDSNAVTIGPKHLPSLGGVHQQLRPAQSIPSFTFVRRQVSRQRPSAALHVATCRLRHAVDSGVAVTVSSIALL